ncbi:MAG: lysophospholipid acyltransferase family protein [Muribaculaceae bacterium]|nr:lysophospholipid acyltransferase family protein [Muribaculaceae bacterium]
MSLAARLGHTLLTAQLHIWTRLPLWLLYLHADVAAAVLYHIVRYRRKVVRRNLEGAFPDMPQTELRRIERQFYRNFADYAVETIKLLHVSDRTILSRMQFEGIELIDSLLDRGLDVACYFSHCGNWEWVPSITLHSRHSAATAAFCQVYRPLKDRRFDALMLRLRSRFGSHSLPKSTVLRSLLRLRHDGLRTVTGFMADQKPSHGDDSFVTTFLNRPTAMITGTETLARRMGMAAVYMDMYKTGRGRYRAVIRPMCDSAAETAPGELTAMYTRMLETTIRRNPAIWLWSHNRWKRPVKL